jgi:hypothetical protein
MKWRYPGRTAVRSVDRPRRHLHLVRERLDRPAGGVGAARRGDRADDRRLRPPVPLHRCRHRHPHPEPIKTGDLVKGSPTLDPDGFPLVYFGSRDNRLRIAALDRDGAGGPVVLRDPEAAVHRSDDQPERRAPGVGTTTGTPRPLIVNDYMFQGGENSVFYIWKLNRGYDADGQVHRRPRARLHAGDLERRAHEPDHHRMPGHRCGPLRLDERGEHAGHVRGTGLLRNSAGW